jgi:hypothetical protein
MDELLEKLIHTIPVDIGKFYNIAAEDGEILMEF